MVPVTKISVPKFLKKFAIAAQEDYSMSMDLLRKRGELHKKLLREKTPEIRKQLLLEIRGINRRLGSISSAEQDEMAGRN